MALAPTILAAAMKDAFIAGETAMELEAKKNIDPAKQIVTNADIKLAGGLAFAAIAGPAIDAYIRSATVTTVVATTGTAAAQAGAGIGAPGVGLT